MGKVPGDTTQSRALLPWTDCLQKMRKDRWPQIVLEHKPKCQTCRRRLKGNPGLVGGGAAGAAKTKFNSRGKTPGKLCR